MSIGLLKVPFLSMINFSSTCGIGLNGAISIKTVKRMRIEYGILSRNANVTPYDYPTHPKFFLPLQNHLKGLLDLEQVWD
jgi:hypothetical protein